MLFERKLTERELDHREVVLKNLLKNKSNLVKKYGKDAEKVMYGIATKKAKKKIEQMNLDSIKELVRTQLEVVDSAPKSTTSDIDINKSYSGGADYGSEVSANTAEDNTEVGELQEGHGLDQGDVDFLQSFVDRMGYDKEPVKAEEFSRLKKILKFILKSNILQDKTRDLSKGKVDENLIKEFISGPLGKRNNALFDKLVPGSGDSETVEGEMIRAINRIIYRFFNDGDYFYKGYGAETAGPAHSFLINSNQIPFDIQSTLTSTFDKAMGADEDGYERLIKFALEKVVDHVEATPEDEYTKLDRGMFDFEPEYEDEEEDDDYYDDYYDEEEEDYYMNEEKEDIGKILKAQKIIKKVLKDEGGAAGLKPIVDALKGLKIGKDELIKILKKTVGVVKHQHGDYIIKPIEERERLAKRNRDGSKNEFAPGGKYFLPDDGYMAAKLRAEDGYFNPRNDTDASGETAEDDAEFAIKNQMGVKDPEKIKKFIDGWMKYNQEVLGVDEGTCGYDRDTNGDKLKGPGGLGEKIDALVREKLTKKSDVGDFVDDFQKSDAKQFKGKSDKKKKEMAVAAYLAKQNEK